MKNKKLIFLKNKFEKNGWVVLRKLYKQSEIKLIAKAINEYLKNQIKKEAQPRNINFVGKSKNLNSINSFHNLNNCKKIKYLSSSHKITKIISFFLDSTPEFRSCEFFAKPAKFGLPSPNHQDNYYWGVKGSNALTIWISLDKSYKKNGAVHYYNGTHKFGILKHKPSFAKGSSQKISDEKFLLQFKKSQPVLYPGDALIHHSLVVHGSEANHSNKSRRGWTIQFKDKKAKYDKEQILNYEKSLYKQISSRL